MKLAPLMEAEIEAASDVLAKLVERLSAMGLGDSISQWLDGDSSQSFFEFQLAPSKESAAAFKSIEMLAAKVYTPSAVVFITIFFEGSLYVVLGDATGEQPLLDSRFPDVSAKGRGYQITAHPDGTAAWPELRKVSVWQTAAALQCVRARARLEIRARASRMGVSAPSRVRVRASLLRSARDGPAPREAPNRARHLAVPAPPTAALDADGVASALGLMKADAKDAAAPAPAAAASEGGGDDGEAAAAKDAHAGGTAAAASAEPAKPGSVTRSYALGRGRPAAGGRGRQRDAAPGRV